MVRLAPARAIDGRSRCRAVCVAPDSLHLAAEPAGPHAARKVLCPARRRRKAQAGVRHPPPGGQPRPQVHKLPRGASSGRRGVLRQRRCSAKSFRRRSAQRAAERDATAAGSSTAARQSCAVCARVGAAWCCACAAAEGATFNPSAQVSGKLTPLHRGAVPHAQGDLPPLRRPLLLHVRRHNRCVALACFAAARGAASEGVTQRTSWPAWRASTCLLRFWTPTSRTCASLTWFGTSTRRAA